MTETDLLVCPATKAELSMRPIDEADRAMGRLVPPLATGFTPVGRTQRVMARTDGWAYPVQDDVPILLVPELLRPAGASNAVDVGDPKYAEAYAEMDHYSDLARREAATVESSQAVRDLAPLLGVAKDFRRSFPEPRGLWLDASYELGAQWDALCHLRPIAGARVLQVGGMGSHAVKFLMAGAREAWVVSPMIGELIFARALARHMGVEARLRCVVGLGEELPFRDGTFDAVYAQGTMHHMETDLAFSECRRVLLSGGRFAAVEPWRGPLYNVGIRFFGKRDPKVQCVVLTAPRVNPAVSVFDGARTIHHGALSRYPLLALAKIGLSPSRRVLWTVGTFDDAVSSLIPRLRRTGSSVAILGTRKEQG